MMKQFSKWIVSIFFLSSLVQLLQASPLPDFTPLVEENVAAVVNISTSSKPNDHSPKMYQIPEMPEGSPFQDFFEKFFGGLPERMVPEQKRSSLGSGFIISEDGYVITNHHVANGADEIIVRLNDRREFIAELVGTDERSDIALLKIEDKGLPVVKLGNSSEVKVGEWVLAIGSPFGFDYSVTQGIVSAIGRNLPRENYVPFIQTDVAINPGNSGGPLFNLDGKVVGVNSQIYSRTGGFMGLSFAVPIDVVADVYRQLRDYGHVSRGWLGVLIQDVTRELAESFDMERPKGALVAKVLSGSPAEKAGLQVGDIIIRFNDGFVGQSSDLPPMVGRSQIGGKATVDIIRSGNTKSLQVLIAKLPSADEVVASSASNPLTSQSNRLNIIVKDLTEEQRQEYGFTDHGVLVTQVATGVAQKAGIHKGDLILFLDSKKIKDAKHFKKLLDGLKAEESVPILIQRGSNPMFLALKLDANKQDN